MILVPPYLKKGDTIGIVCPAGYMDYNKAVTCINELQQWGYRVKVGKTLGGNSANYFSGTDEERLEDFQQMLDDEEIKAILCGRGGYGVGRIIDAINFKKFRKRPKWIIGFSDITIFHTHINTNFKIATLHAPMAAAFNDEGFLTPYVKSLRQALQGKKLRYDCAPHPLNRTGVATGELIGGNLALLAHGIGTKSQVSTKNKILFIEDIGEYKYNIDRMMYQLQRSGKLAHLQGLIVGKFSDVKDTDRPFGEEVGNILQHFTKDYSYPVCYDFPVGHDADNYALKTGMNYSLVVKNNKVTLKEL